MCLAAWIKFTTSVIFFYKRKHNAPIPPSTRKPSPVLNVHRAGADKGGSSLLGYMEPSVGILGRVRPLGHCPLIRPLLARPRSWTKIFRVTLTWAKPVAPMELWTMNQQTENKITWTLQGQAFVHPNSERRGLGTFPQETSPCMQLRNWEQGNPLGNQGDASADVTASWLGVL